MSSGAHLVSTPQGRSEPGSQEAAEWLFLKPWGTFLNGVV